MKKLILLLILLGIGAVYFFRQTDKPITSILSDRDNPKVEQTISPTSVEAKKSVFVPYWTLQAQSSTDGYEEAFYFGIEADLSGINKDEVGYTRLNQFLDIFKDVPTTILVVRMVDKEVNSDVSKDVEAQTRIASESVAIAKEYGFDGVMLDYEISSIAFDEVTERNTNFFKIFSKEVKKENLLFYSALMGDTYYRVRAYDVKQIGMLSDKVIIMTYDFHKSRGNPGPNFPLTGKDTYGYDLAQMIDDFSNDIPLDKLDVTFGMFGYDWRVDEDGKSVGYGEPLSTREISGKFIDECRAKECKWERDSESQEISIKYVTEDDEEHIVWFEDEESVKRKKDYLQRIGIGYISYWAYSYY